MLDHVSITAFDCAEPFENYPADRCARVVRAQRLSVR
jgi:hypothetical protein